MSLDLTTTTLLWTTRSLVSTTTKLLSGRRDEVVVLDVEVAGVDD